MSNLVIVLFEGRHTADKALLRVAKMSNDWKADINEFIVITRDTHGEIRIKNSDTLSATGMMIGALADNPAAGLLMGAAAGSGLGTLDDAADHRRADKWRDADDRWVPDASRYGMGMARGRRRGLCSDRNLLVRPIPENQRQSAWHLRRDFASVRGRRVRALCLRPEDRHGHVHCMTRARGQTENFGCAIDGCSSARGIGHV